MRRVVAFNHILDLDKLTNNPVIIDAGANTGGYIDYLNTLDINPKIIALECSRTNFNTLTKKTYEGLISLPDALGGEIGTATFSEFVGPPKKDGTRKYNQWGNINGNFKNKLKNDAELVEYEVPVITLEKLMDFYDIEYIDFLKMDIEGGEYDVINSITQELAEKIGQISMETHNVNKNPVLIQKLKDLGYKIEEHKGLEIYAYR